MKVEISILALAAALALAPGVAGADGVESFKDWTVVCDNLRNCQVAGFAADDTELPAVLRLSRAAAASAPAKVEIDLLGEISLGGKAPALAVDGRVVMTAKVVSSRDSADFTVVLDDAQVGPLLGAARNGTLLSIQDGGKELGRVSLAGMVAALRYADDQQKRAGTVTAMVAKGAVPAAGVPAPPPAPVLHAAPAVAQTGLPAKPPAAIKALFSKAECDLGPGRDDKPEAFRLSADKVLWQVPCWGAAYNFGSLFVIADKADRLSLALEGVGDGVLVNAEYDPKTRLLSAYNKGRGIGDCGDSSQWVWTGEAFALSEATVMPVCRGYGGDWPTTFHAEVR
ncbi:hypothetical protein ASD38_02185 [Caulobacter sp. Root487D2Y]|uniref:DUF1176 domain-containing protein n=1 Tax=Caulobacter sp. Root487D2Y TaxID=1736547 RepID=UPI0006FAAF4B|nr:DUF1176 domain-containing protein [Caulobacter sp. Root487D2Y]KQY35393.1 hypothetical protein ASD38_02185 [Caulobacter sp. Root487D2Y]